MTVQLKGIMSMCIKTLGPSLSHSTEVASFEFKTQLIQIIWNTLYYCKANIYFAFQIMKIFILTSAIILVNNKIQNKKNDLCDKHIDEFIITESINNNNK